MAHLLARLGDWFLRLIDTDFTPAPTTESDDA